jgi:predicted O-linked N-acetylglucosamine transferase (SPINDLY family)
LARISPALAAIRDKAQRLHAEGNLAAALEAHDEALHLAPTAIGVLLSAGRLAHELGRDEASLDYFERAARLDTAGSTPAAESARRIAIGAGLCERARRASVAPTAVPTTTRLALELCVPAIPLSTDEMHASRRRYDRALDRLMAGDLRLEEPDDIAATSAFFLAYHGEDDRALQVKTAQMFLHVIPSLAMTAPHCVAGPRRPGRLRIGFISRFFRSHSICATSQGLIAHLSRDRFEVYALRIMPSPADTATARIRAAADHHLDLDPRIYRARDQIAALGLDVLFYQDIGMEPKSYFLAFSRLAPVQCVSFGHPNTTGIPTMDYFISNDLYEVPQGASHYSEKLYQLHDLPTLAYYEKPRVVDAPNRGGFGLPLGKNLYVCPQMLHKLHPDFDPILRGILAQDPDGLVVLIEGQFADHTARLRQRFRLSLSGLDARVLFLPRMHSDRFLELLSVADVILDTLHFNGMNTSLEAFAQGAPVVTLPTRHQRGRHTQAMYRKMRIVDGVVRDTDDYIATAVRLCRDRDRAAALRGRIAAANSVLFGDVRVISEFERFFLDAAARSAVF